MFAMFVSQSLYQSVCHAAKISGSACSVRRVPCARGHSVQPSPNAFGLLLQVPRDLFCWKLLFQAGLRATSHGEAVIETSDGIVDIRFTLDPRVKAVIKNVLHNELDAWLLSHHALLREDNGQLVVSMRLPQKGEYALKLFAESEAQQFESELQNVCNYLIRCLNTNTGIQPFPKLHEGKTNRTQDCLL